MFQTVPFEFSEILHIVERINDFKKKKKKRKIISPVRESLSSVFTDNTVDILLLKRTRQYPPLAEQAFHGGIIAYV